MRKDLTRAAWDMVEELSDDDEYGRPVQYRFEPGGRVVVVWSCGAEYIITEHGGMEAVGHVKRNSNESYTIDIDHNNSSGSMVFRITKDGETSTLFTVSEDGSIKDKDGNDIRPGEHDHDTLYAPIAKGVTNGDSHNHVGGDGAQVDHGGLGGLSDDDHINYHTDARGDARYLYRENTGAFTPDGDYEPATKKYADDLITSYDTGWVACSDWTNQHLGTEVGGNVVHNLNTNLCDLLVVVLFSTDGTDNNSYLIGDFQSAYFGTNTYGVQVRQVDANNIVVQTGVNGMVYTNDDGAAASITTESWYYKIKVWKLS